MSVVTQRLFSLADVKYRDFMAGLVPSVNKAKVVGVRIPVLRTLAKDMIMNGSANAFIEEVPHLYYDENLLHAQILNLISNDAYTTLAYVRAFLPYVDNWAVCDAISPVCFKKMDAESVLYEHICGWIENAMVYTVRYAVTSFLKYFLDESFQPSMLILPAKIQTDEYYVNMSIAWYYSTALAKQYKATIPIFESKMLNKWVHNKSLQKAIESFRVSDDKKAYMRTLKVR